jgi:hypothetical protein
MDGKMGGKALPFLKAVGGEGVSLNRSHIGSDYPLPSKSSREDTKWLQLVSTHRVKILLFNTNSNQMIDTHT